MNNQLDTVIETADIVRFVKAERWAFGKGEQQQRGEEDGKIETTGKKSILHRINIRQ